MHACPTWTKSSASACVLCGGLPVLAVQARERQVVLVDVFAHIGGPAIEIEEGAELAVGNLDTGEHESHGFAHELDAAAFLGIEQVAPHLELQVLDPVGQCIVLAQRDALAIQPLQLEEDAMLLEEQILAHVRTRRAAASCAHRRARREPLRRVSAAACAAGVLTRRLCEHVARPHTARPHVARPHVAQPQG